VWKDSPNYSQVYTKENTPMIYAHLYVQTNLYTTEVLIPVNTITHNPFSPGIDVHNGSPSYSRGWSGGITWVWKFQPPYNIRSHSTIFKMSRTQSQIIQYLKNHENLKSCGKRKFIDTNTKMTRLFWITWKKVKLTFLNVPPSENK
jgi:hypothetical protein